MISYRKVALDNHDEMQAIAAIDMTIPAIYDPLFQVNEKTISDRLAQLLKCKPDDFFEVAVDESEKIVGFHFLNKFKSAHGVLAANIQTLWVDPAYRNQGLGKKLKLRGEVWAKEQNLDHISTFVHSKNPAMLKLNENQKFEIVGYQLRKSLDSNVT